ncbi:MAG TPA: diacylglycerol kinase family protein [Ktedonobacteraceae bacterium]|nr:diacylglycerol kinase family protein [Ktedonobacteraceae bacterium]
MDAAQFSGRTLVILNPAANRGKMNKYRAAARRRAEDEDAEYVETRLQGEAKERAMQAACEDRPVIIVGGDGSVHEAVNGILAAGRQVPLGIVGAGSGNDFAWNTLKLPREPEMAVERAFHGQLAAVDAGIVNGRYFANSCSIGIDADIAVAASGLKKYPFMSGLRLYYTSTLKQLLFGYGRCPWLSFELEGEARTVEAGKVPDRRYVLMAVTNGPTYGAGFRINPTADHCDGLFDICTIAYTPLLRALKLLPLVQKGQHAGIPEVTFYRAKSLAIQSRKPVNMQMDGETTYATSFHIEILPAALLVRV